MNRRAVVLTSIAASAVLASTFLAPLHFIRQATPVDAAVTPAEVTSVSATIALLRSRVKHVFIIYQENRSFDSYFGTYPGADGLYSRPPSQTPGFLQRIVDVDGSITTIRPFRIGPHEFAADTDDIDHSHSVIDAKMDDVDGTPRMDRFALGEEQKYAKGGLPSLMAKQMGELAMAHEDCDTVPFLWLYAKRFVLFDHVFQQMTGPSTPGNLAIIGAQSGETQWMLTSPIRSRLTSTLDRRRIRRPLRRTAQPRSDKGRGIRGVAFRLAARRKLSIRTCAFHAAQPNSMNQAEAV